MCGLKGVDEEAVSKQQLLSVDGKFADFFCDERTSSTLDLFCRQGPFADSR